MKIRAVLFDLDGTLLDRRETFRRHVAFMIDRHAGVFGDRRGADVIDVLVELDGHGDQGRPEFYRSVELHLDLAEGASSLLLQYFEEHYPESCVPMPNTFETLETLGDLKVKVGLITNGRALIQNRKIDGLGIRECLQSIIISDEFGTRKPDTRIFQAALEEVSVPAAAAAYVGDHPEADICGAKRAGLLAVWRRDPWFTEPEEADLVIDDLDELVPLLQDVR